MTIPILFSVLFPVTFRSFFRWLTACRNARVTWSAADTWKADDLVVSREAEERRTEQLVAKFEKLDGITANNFQALQSGKRNGRMTDFTSCAICASPVNDQG